MSCTYRHSQHPVAQLQFTFKVHAAGRHFYVVMYFEFLIISDHLLQLMQDLKLLSLETGDYPRAMQYEADVLAVSPGLNDIIKADSVYSTEVLPQAQALMK